MKRRVILPIALAALAALLAAGCSDELLQGTDQTRETSAVPGDIVEGQFFCPTEQGNPDKSAGVGDKSVVIVMVEFMDTEPEDAFISEDEDYIDGVMFSGPLSVDAIYREMSSDAAAYHGDLVGPYVIDHSATEDCEFHGDQDGDLQVNYHLWEQAAYDLAVLDGVLLDDYDTIVYVFPESTECFVSSGGDLVRIGGYRGTGHITMYLWHSPNNWAHEFGHERGFGHSDWDDGSLDLACLMSRTGWVNGSYAPVRHVNGYWQRRATWFEEARTLEITEGGTHVVQIAPVERRNDEIVDPPVGTAYQRVVVNPLGLYSSGDAPVITYRRQEGDFEVNPYFDDMYGRAMIHRSNTGFFTSKKLAELLQGESYTDGFYTITPLDDQAHGADDYITVQIDIPTPECGVYEVSFAEAMNYRNVAPKTGALLPGFVTIDNQADELCQDPLSLNVYGTIGQGDDWLVAYPDPQDQFSVDVESGESTTAGVVMEVQQTLPEGTYSMNVSARVFGADIDPGFYDYTLTYVVDLTDPTTPANPAVAITAANTVTFSWNAATDVLAGIDFYEIERNGSVVESTAGTSFVDDNRSLDETYTYRVRANDKAGNVGEWSSPVAVEIPAIVISNIQVTHDGINCTKTVTWTTNVPSSSVVYFGNSCSALGYVDYGAGNTTSHTVVCDVYDLRTFAFQVSSSANYVTETSACTTTKRGKCISM